MPLCLTTELCPVLPNLRKRKTLQSSKKITTLSIPCSLVTDTSYLPSVSTSAISFAVALTIRMPLSLIPSRSASSCRRCVFFSGGVSSLTFLRLSLRPVRAAFIAAPKALKSYFGTGLFAIIIHPITFYCSPFFLDMSTLFY